jgi:hypothetical protein
MLKLNPESLVSIQDIPSSWITVIDCKSKGEFTVIPAKKRFPIIFGHDVRYYYYLFLETGIQVTLNLKTGMDSALHQFLLQITTELEIIDR